MCYSAIAVFFHWDQEIATTIPIAYDSSLVPIATNNLFLPRQQSTLEDLLAPKAVRRRRNVGVLFHA